MGKNVVLKSQELYYIVSMYNYYKLILFLRAKLGLKWGEDVVIKIQE